MDSDGLYYPRILHYVIHRIDLKWIFSVEVVVVCLNLAIFIPELGQIFSRFENEEDWHDNTNHDILHQEVDYIEDDHGLVVGEVIQSEHDVLQN